MTDWLSYNSYDRSCKFDSSKVKERTRKENYNAAFIIVFKHIIMPSRDVPHTLAYPTKEKRNLQKPTNQMGIKSTKRIEIELLSVEPRVGIALEDAQKRILRRCRIAHGSQQRG